MVQIQRLLQHSLPLAPDPFLPGFDKCGDGFDPIFHVLAADPFEWRVVGVVAGVDVGVGQALEGETGAVGAAGPSEEPEPQKSRNSEDGLPRLGWCPPWDRLQTRYNQT